MAQAWPIMSLGKRAKAPRMNGAMISAETKSRSSASMNGSTLCSAVLPTTNDVPHKIPANNRKNINPHRNGALAASRPPFAKTQAPGPRPAKPSPNRTNPTQSESILSQPGLPQPRPGPLPASVRLGSARAGYDDARSIRSPRPIPAAPVRTVSRIESSPNSSTKASSLSVEPVISMVRVLSETSTTRPR